MAEGKQQYILSHIKKVSRNGEEKTYFDRVGRGFQNKDGSFNIWLETLPVGTDTETTFHLGIPKPKESRGQRGGFKDKQQNVDDDIPF